jgi:hypothetical protein
MPEAEYQISADFYLVQISAAFGLIRTSPRPLAALRLHRANSYSTLPLEEKNRNDQQRYEDMCHRLGEYLQTLDLSANPLRWAERSGWYKRMRRLEQSVERVRKVVPAGEAFILADEGNWLREGPPAVFADRVTVPFFPAVMQGDTLPPDGAAIRELEGLRGRGIRFIVFAWPGTRWLRDRPRLRDYLRTTTRRMSEEDPIVFDLQAVPPRPGDPLPSWLPPDSKAVTMEPRSSLTGPPDFDLPLRDPALSDRQLIRLLERHRVAGAGFLVLPRSLQWWLDLHDGVASYVRRTYGPPIEDREFIAYKLQGSTQVKASRRRADSVTRGAAR